MVRIGTRAHGVQRPGPSLPGEPSARHGHPSVLLGLCPWAHHIALCPVPPPAALPHGLVFWFSKGLTTCAHTRMRAHACTGMHAYGLPPRHEGAAPRVSHCFSRARKQSPALAASASACRITRSPSHEQPEENQAHGPGGTSTLSAVKHPTQPWQHTRTCGTKHRNCKKKKKGKTLESRVSPN